MPTVPRLFHRSLRVDFDMDQDAELHQPVSAHGFRQPQILGD